MVHPQRFSALVEFRYHVEKEQKGAIGNTWQRRPEAPDEASLGGRRTSAACSDRYGPLIDEVLNASEENSPRTRSHTSIPLDDLGSFAVIFRTG